MNVLMDRDWSMICNLSLGLIDVNLGVCRIDDIGAEILANMKWPKLQKLDFSSPNLIMQPQTK